MSSNNSIEKASPDLILEYEERRMQDPRYLKYINYKSIPFSFQLGFLTLSVGSVALETIKERWCQSAAQDDVNKRVAGVCFGQKKNTHIDIEQCFEFGYNSDENIITDGGFYNTDLEFLGIYSSGSIPDDSDVCILQRLSKALRSSLFLIKFKYSETINELSTVIFESVFDISLSNFSKNLKLIEVHPQEGIINNEEHNDCDVQDSKTIFYLPFWEQSHLFLNRYDLDISDDLRSKLNERRENFKVKPTFRDYRHVLMKLAKDKGWKFSDFKRFDANKDYVKMAKELCNEAKIKLRFFFRISLDGNHQCLCVAQFLNYRASGLGLTIKESHACSALNFWRRITDESAPVSGQILVDAKKRKRMEEDSISDGQNFSN